MDTTKRSTAKAHAWRVAILVGVLTGVIATLRYVRASAAPSDLDQLWYAARALVRGDDPYLAVGPDRAFAWPWPLYYPLPAVLLVVPFSFLPIAVARLVWSVLSAGVLGYAVANRWRVAWPMFLSMAYFLAISRNQWSPLILSTVWLPFLGVVFAAKPNIAAIALAAQSRRNALYACALAGGLLAASFVARPSWLVEWFPIVRSLPNQQIAVLQPAGFLLLGAALFWRTLAGRTLLVAAIIPQTPALYDLLPLFAGCTTTRQSLILAFLTHLLQWILIANGPYPTLENTSAHLERLVVGIIYLPLLVLLLHQRFRGTIFPVNPATPDESARPAPRTWLDLVLTVTIAVSLGVQLWLLYHP